MMRTLLLALSLGASRAVRFDLGELEALGALNGTEQAPPTFTCCCKEGKCRHDDNKPAPKGDDGEAALDRPGEEGRSLCCKRKTGTGCSKFWGLIPYGYKLEK